MVGNENAVNVIYIQNYDLSEYVCEYYLKSGESYQRTRLLSGVKDSDLWKGFYINLNDNSMIGVFASENGPNLFFNRETFLLSDKNCKVELIKKSPSCNCFNLYWQSEKKISISYTKKVQEPFLNPYEDEESVDFFLWVYNSINDENFYKYFTVK